MFVNVQRLDNCYGVFETLNWKMGQYKSGQDGNKYF